MSREAPEPLSAKEHLLERGEKQWGEKNQQFSAFPDYIWSQVDLSGVRWAAPLGFGRVNSQMAAGFLALWCCEQQENL